MMETATEVNVEAELESLPTSRNSLQPINANKNEIIPSEKRTTNEDAKNERAVQDSYSALQPENISEKAEEDNIESPEEIVKFAQKQVKDPTTELNLNIKDAEKTGSQILSNKLEEDGNYHKVLSDKIVEKDFLGNVTSMVMSESPKESEASTTDKVTAFKVNMMHDDEKLGTIAPKSFELTVVDKPLVEKLKCEDKRESQQYLLDVDDSNEDENDGIDTECEKEVCDEEDAQDIYSEEEEYDDDDLVDKDKEEDSNEAVIIESSSDEDEEQLKTISRKMSQPQRTQPRYGVLNKIGEEHESLDDDDESMDFEDEDYDDDDLMNAVVTSAFKGISKSCSRSQSSYEESQFPTTSARKRETDQIRILTRRLNYGKIAKKRSLKWLNNRNKRDAYKSILLKKSSCAQQKEQMSADELLYIKSEIFSNKEDLFPANVSQNCPHILNPEQTSKILQTSSAQTQAEVIDLDSSPEKREHCQNIISTKSIKSEPIKLDNFDVVISQKATMQQTNKIRDAIQKSEDMDESNPILKVVSATLEFPVLDKEQNKENLQSNDKLSKELVEQNSENHNVLVTKEETVETINSEAESNETTLKEQYDKTIVPNQELAVKSSKINDNKFSSEILSADITRQNKQNEKLLLDDYTAPPQPITAVVDTGIAAATKRRRSSSSRNEEAIETHLLPKNLVGEELLKSDESDDCIHPTKKLRAELQSQYPKHDCILNEYIDKTSNDSIDNIDRHIIQMLSEIETLSEMIKAKEIEWNNILHLKKVKEEICYRLTRRKQVMELMATKVGEVNNANSAGVDLDEYLRPISNTSVVAKTSLRPNPVSSTPIAAVSYGQSINLTSVCNFASDMSTSTASVQNTNPSCAQLIIQNRANMRSSDLAKEKANTQRLHRILVSRNILPKPSSNSSAANATKENRNQGNQLGNTGSSLVVTNGPTAAQQQTILNTYLSSAESVQQLVEMINGHHNPHSTQNGGNVNNNLTMQQQMVGRQGPFKDVKSIIADFRQQHPEVIPRRGRRVKNSNSNLSDSNSILGNALKSDTNSRPSSNDSSSHSNGNINQISSANNGTTANSVSFKDVLGASVKMSERSTSATAMTSNAPATTLRNLNTPAVGGNQLNPPYPEVTLHPVTIPQNSTSGIDQPTGSLLHGILTKFSRPAESGPTTKSTQLQHQHQQPTSATSNYISNFSPTLARLLTAPERISVAGNNNLHQQSVPSTLLNQNNNGGGGGGNGSNKSLHSIPSFGVNLSKVVGHHNSEITITPVMNSMHQQSMLQQQLQQQQQLKDVLTRAAAVVANSGINNSSAITKEEQHFLKLSYAGDDDAEDSVDRLVIDEGVDSIINEEQGNATHAIGQEINENEVPLCQGCKRHEAQFVCAGCGNQWYCSRECQVTAWDDHSEVCTATKQIRKNFNLLKTKDLVSDEEYFIVRRKKRNNVYRPI